MRTSWPRWRCSATRRAHRPAVGGDHRRLEAGRGPGGAARPCRAAALDLWTSGDHDPHRQAVLRRGDRVSDPDRRPARALPGQQGAPSGSRSGCPARPGADLLPAAGRQRGGRRARRRRVAGPRTRDRRPCRALGARCVRACARRQRRERQPAHDLPPGADPPEGLPPLPNARGAAEHADAMGRARQLHGRAAQGLSRCRTLAPPVPGRKPEPGRGAALRRQRLAGRSAAALPPDRDGGEPQRRRGLSGRPGAAVRQPGPEAARVDRDAHPQQRLSAAPGDAQRPDRRRASPPTSPSATATSCGCPWGRCRRRRST